MTRYIEDIGRPFERERNRCKLVDTKEPLHFYTTTEKACCLLLLILFFFHSLVPIPLKLHMGSPEAPSILARYVYGGASIGKEESSLCNSLWNLQHAKRGLFGISITKKVVFVVLLVLLDISVANF